MCDQNNDKKESILRVKCEKTIGNIALSDEYVSLWEAIQNGTQGATFIMSCSDKIASWNVLGVQGGILSLFITPIYLQSIVISELFDHRNISRALYGRVNNEILKNKLDVCFKTKHFNLNMHKIGNYQPVNNYEKITLLVSQ